VPFETLSNLARRRAHPSDPDAWVRTTDRVLKESATVGTGGTCFATAYALAEVLRGLGANAHTTLGHHLAKDEPHAAVIVYEDDGPWLFDTAFLLPCAMPVRPGGSVEDRLHRHELVARRGPMLTLVQTAKDGATKPLYSWIPMPAFPVAFREAWIAAFRRRMESKTRIARRVGDEIFAFGGERGPVEVLAPDGRREIDCGGDVPGTLHRVFGIDEAFLRSHFAAAG
jgi:arylamine N-acetyltransferase